MPTKWSSSMVSYLQFMLRQFIQFQQGRLFFVSFLNRALRVCSSLSGGWGVRGVWKLDDFYEFSLFLLVSGYWSALMMLSKDFVRIVDSGIDFFFMIFYLIYLEECLFLEELLFFSFIIDFKMIFSSLYKFSLRLIFLIGVSVFFLSGIKVETFV